MGVEETCLVQPINRDGLRRGCDNEVMEPRNWPLPASLAPDYDR